MPESKFKKYVDMSPRKQVRTLTATEVAMEQVIFKDGQFDASVLDDPKYKINQEMLNNMYSGIMDQMAHPKFSRTVILDLGALKAQTELPEDVWPRRDKEPPEHFRIAYSSAIVRAYVEDPISYESIGISYLEFRIKEIMYYRGIDPYQNYNQAVYILEDFHRGATSEPKPQKKKMEKIPIRKLMLEDK